MTIDQVVGHCEQTSGGSNSIRTNDFRTTSTDRDGNVEVTHWKLEVDETGFAKERIISVATQEQRDLMFKSLPRAKGC